MRQKSAYSVRTVQYCAVLCSRRTVGGSVAVGAAGERAHLVRRVLQPHRRARALPAAAESVALEDAAEDAEQTENESGRAENAAERYEEELLGRRAARTARAALENAVQPVGDARRAALSGHRRRALRRANGDTV